MVYQSTEVPGSRRGDNTRSTRQYYVWDCENEEEDVYDFVGNLPDELGTHPFADFEYEETEEIDDAFLVTVNWGDPQTVTQEKDTLDYRFNFQAPGGHIYQSLATVAGYYDGDKLFGVPPFNGAINVIQDKKGQRVEGMNLSPPAEVFTLSYKVSGSVITSSYQDLVLSLCGKVNSEAFRGKPAGTVMLVRVTGGRDSSNVWTIEFGFGYIANSTDVPVGDVAWLNEAGTPADIAKDGFDLLWCFYPYAKDGTGKMVLKQPAAVYIERVFERADLNLLNLPA
jgi:hypothetical protein